jgi:hypothetical protein
MVVFEQEIVPFRYQTKIQPMGFKPHTRHDKRRLYVRQFEIATEAKEITWRT